MIGKLFGHKMDRVMLTDHLFVSAGVDFNQKYLNISKSITISVNY